MIKYLLTVVKYEDNFNYEAELAKWREGRDQWGNRRSGMSNDRDEQPPMKEIPVRSLEVILDESEYILLKGEVIKTFK